MEILKPALWQYHSSYPWEQLVKISACCAALVKIDFLAVHPLTLLLITAHPDQIFES